MKESPRRRSRAVALQVLYGLDLGARGGARRDAQEAFDEVARHFELPEGARAFAKELVLGVCAQRERLDALLSEHARNWRVERMAAVDRNVLRLGAYELLCSEVPAAVVIDEAVALARRFGDDPSPRFVNGILDAVAHQVRAPERPSGEAGEADG